MSPAFSSAAPKGSWTEADHPLWAALLAGCALATVLPLFLGRHLPFTDLPQHVAAIASLRHWFDPSWKVQQVFTLDLGGSPYWVYYLAGALLAFPLCSAERANVALLASIGLAFPYALRFLLRALRRDERLALFASPLFWCQSLLIGFFNFLAALPLLCLSLGLVARQTRAASRRGEILLAACALALFYLHLSAFLFFVPAAIAALLLLRSSSPRRSRLLGLLHQLRFLVPAALAAALLLLRSPVANPAAVGWREPLALRFEAPEIALRNLPAALLDIWTGPGDELVLLALLFAFALLALPRRASPEERTAGGETAVIAVWVFLAAALYFAFPVSIGWLWQLNERYAIVLALLAPALLRPIRGLRGAIPLLLVAATALFSAGTAHSGIAAFQREVGDFDAILALARPGRRMIGLIYDFGSRTARFAPFLHYASYYRARGGAVASFSFAELPQTPLRYRPEATPPPKPAGWEWHPETYRNEVDGLYYDYVLIRGREVAFPAGSGGPLFLPLARSGPWALYEKAR